MRIFVTTISLLISYFILKLVKKERFLYSAMFLVYLIWHLPLIVSIILPLTFPLKTQENIIFIILVLIAIHTIQLGGAVAYSNYASHQNQQQNNNLITNKLSKTNPPTLYIIGAYLAPVFFVIDNYIIRKLPLSLELAETRSLRGESLFEESANFFTLAGTLCSGFAIYLINYFYKNKIIDNKTDVKLNVYFILPFLVNSIIILLSGNRHFFITGITIFILNAIAFYKPHFNKFIKRLVLFVLFFIPFLFIYQYLRSVESLATGIDDVVLSLLDIEFEPNHPLTSFIQFNSIRVLGAVYLYMYAGVEYDVLASAIQTIQPYAPFASLTFPVLYRRISGIFLLPDQSDIKGAYHDVMEEVYGIFSNIWGTMYLSIYLEGGIVYIIFSTIVICYIHYFLTKAYCLNNKKNISSSLNKDHLNNLVFFYAFMMLAIMLIPTHDPSFFFALIAVIIKPSYSYLTKKLLPTKK